MCEDERYRSLEVHEEEDSKEAEEEESKRSKSNAFAFDYNRFSIKHFKANISNQGTKL